MKFRDVGAGRDLHLRDDHDLQPVLVYLNKFNQLLLELSSSFGKKHSVDYIKSNYRNQCKTCPVKNLCTGRTQGGREIDRGEFAEAVFENKTRYNNNKDIYRKRQEINEHIFGTIKRQWGYNHTQLKGLEKVNGEMALIMTVYNIKRTINILGIEKLLKKIKNWKPNYKGIIRSFSKRINFKAIYELQIISSKIAA